jgi:lipopolysaccharide assembly protein A
MKTLRIAFWAVVGLCLIIVGLANRGTVTVRAMPEALAGLFGISPDVTLPLFVVILTGVAVGLLVGFVWEWLREHAQRAEARAKERQIADLQREVGRLRAEKSVGKDEVLALLEAPATRRT